MHRLIILLICIPLIVSIPLNSMSAATGIFFKQLVAEPRALEARVAKNVDPIIKFQPGNVAFSNSRWEYDYDQWQLGNTWYDYQHNGSQGKQIVIGDDGSIHFAWMKGFDAGANNRHVVYDCYEGWGIPGNSVDNTGRSGYCTIDVFSPEALHPDAAVVAFHQQPEADFITTVSPDYGPCWKAFYPCNHPVVEQWDDDQPIWPHLAVDINNRVHIIATRSIMNTAWYSCYIDSAIWQTPDWIELPTYSNSISAVPVTSEFSTDVVLLTLDRLSFPPELPYKMHDIWAFIAPDGDFTDFDQVTSVNITDFMDPETNGHPLPGRVYAYSDVEGLYDDSGNLHVAYTTFPYWQEVTMIDGEEADGTFIDRTAHTGQIWHALVSTDGEVLEFSHIAGYVGENNQDNTDFASYYDGDPGTWGLLNDRPSLSIDPASGTLYCMWRSFINHADTSVAGFSNADLWIRSSCDNGSNWGPAVNITDSFTPACEPGECASEAWGTLAEVTFDGNLHLEFVEDLDAGAIPQDEGSWTDNPVWYLRVPIADVPCGDPWDAAAHATHLTDSFWAWGLLEDGSYEITDFMQLFNEGQGTLTLQTIELLYHHQLPDIDIIQLNGNLGDDIPPYQTGGFQYVWNAIIGDNEYDAIIRFHTNGGTVDYKLANRNPLDLETAQSYFLWEDVPHSKTHSPETFTLAQNYPNPFNPTTMIEYTLTVSSIVQLEIYNTLGETVAQPVNGFRATGKHRVFFDAGGLAGGIYLYRLTAGENSVSRKMILIQ